MENVHYKWNRQSWTLQVEANDVSWSSWLIWEILEKTWKHQALIIVAKEGELGVTFLSYPKENHISQNYEWRVLLRVVNLLHIVGTM